MNSEAKLVLVLGGARSGKSGFAEKYTLHSGSYCGYIATAEILDEEMAERVRIHRARRDNRWITFEAPYEAHTVLEDAGHRCDSILFDDVTMFVCNILYGKEALTGTTEEKGAVVREKVKLLMDAARKTGKTVVFVSNETGCGIVPDNPMAREYRDISGWVNQQIGEAADAVYVVVAGQAVDIKKLAFKFED